MRSSVSALVAGSARNWLTRRRVATLTALGLVLLGSPLGAGTAQAADTRVNLRVLVVTDGEPSVQAIATQLDREGVPYTTLDLAAPGRPVVDAAFLADAATSTARFQAVVLPNETASLYGQPSVALSSSELVALADYERAYGIREVDADIWSSPSLGLNWPTYSGSLDGAALTVSAAGRSGPFGYLTGSLAVDDFDPSVSEVYGNLAQPLATQAAGDTFTPLLTASVHDTATGTDTTGVLAGVHTGSGREQLVLTAAFNPSMQWFSEVGHGLVTWMTRGIHLGYQRNYFAVQVDDVFLPDSRWSVSANCTPGDGCVDPSVTTPDIRMTPADVARLTDWQKAHGFALDMVFNGGGSDLYAAANNNQPDALAAAFQAVQGSFTWINHTYTHPFLGCIQIAPTVVGQTWSCATDPAQTPRQDPDIPGTMQGGTYWASQQYILGQVQQNIAWATKAGLTHFDPSQLVTGEHSGLATAPQQPTDNPFLAPALAQAGVKYTASDASREADSRAVGSSTVTVPRHPMNVYYNAATYQEEVDEYNFYYTTRANGGGGICEDNPATSTCITPLAAGDATQSQASFDGYIKPLEIRNALRYALTNDPRPFFAHQSNLAEDGILYPVVEGVLGAYRSVYAANAPLVHTDLRAQAELLRQMTAWRASSATTTAYLDSAGVHVPAAAVSVPVTVPAGTRVTGATFASYGGELSGWTSASVVAAPPGYGPPPVVATVPAAPLLGSVTAGNRSATLAWTAPADGGSPITGYVVSVYQGSAASPLRTVAAAANATGATVTGLTNGTSYSFTVAAVNAVGTGPASARSKSVTPLPTAPGAPTSVAATPGNKSLRVSWKAPADDGGSPVLAYVISGAPASGGPAQRTVVLGWTTAVIVGNLVNGAPYTVTVAAVNLFGTGAAAGPAGAVTPSR